MERDALLQDDKYTEIVLPDVCVTPQTFGNRLEAGQYFVTLLEGADSALLRERRVGVWSWLSLYFFDAVCPANKGGKRKVRRDERYIPEDDYRRFYRHLLLGPFSICQTHSDDLECALAVLCPPVDKPGDIVENLTARQDLVACPAVMAVATELYVNKDGKHRRGAPGGKGEKPGNVRSLARVMMQFDLTYDLFYKISKEHLLDILPEEFDDFRTATD